MNAICLVVDRLHAGYLGAYGNTWIETPALDRLASRSAVFDRAVIDSPHLGSIIPLVLAGMACNVSGAAAESRPSLPALLRDAGIATTVLLTDEPQVARHPLAAEFRCERIEIDPPLANGNGCRGSTKRTSPSVSSR